MTRLINPKSCLLQLKISVFILCVFYGSFIVAQQNESINGHWTLEKMVFNNTKTKTTTTKKNLANLFKAALYKTLDKEQQLMLEELDLINTKAEELANIYFQSKIEFQTNRAFYNRSKLLEQPTSGEYLLDGKKLLMEWETADKYTYKILKINTSELVFKDVELKVAYYYTKTKTN